MAFLVKIIVLAVLAFLIFIVYTESNKAENKMKGFDAFEILGLSRGATLRDVKKAYRYVPINAGNLQLSTTLIKTWEILMPRPNLSAFQRVLNA